MIDEKNPPSTPQTQESVQEATERLNRKELRLARAIGDMVDAVDDLPGPYWFSKVFDDYTRRMTDNRKLAIRAMLCTAINVLDGVEPTTLSTPVQIPTPPQPPQPT